MSEHKAKIRWTRQTPDFNYETYNREHTWTMKDGQAVRASAAVAFKGKPDCVDPEEALVAALAGCHMLTFLAIAAKKKLTVDEYTDEAVGHLETDESGKMRVTRIELHPRTVFSGGVDVSNEQLARLHDTAHHNCFIANSIKSQVRVVLS